MKDFKNGRPIAYRMIGDVNIANILTTNDSKLLKFTLKVPQLHVRPHGSDSQSEFHYHKSPIDAYENHDFYAIWKLGNISHIYVEANENVALTNIKKAIVSLFQFQTNEGDYKETGAAGVCDVQYRQTSPTGVRQMRQSCVQKSKSNHFIRPETPLQVNAQNYRTTDYRFFPDGTIDKIESRDYFHIALDANRDIGGSVDSIVVLHSNDIVTNVQSINDKTPKEFLSQLKNYKGESLETISQHIDVPIDSNIKKAIEQYETDLVTSNIGTIPSAKAFLHILPIARAAQKHDIIQLLKSKKLAEIKV